MGETTIHRVGRKNRFSIVDQKLIEDECLSWRALGLLIFLLSLPDDWVVNMTHLIKCSERRSGMKRDATYATLGELVKAGYVVRKRKRDSAGMFCGYQYEVYEQPVRDPDSPYTDYPDTGNPRPDKPEADHPDAVEPDSGHPNPVNPTLPNTQTIPKTNTTTYKSEGGGELIWPEVIDKEEMRAAADIVSILPAPLAQDVIDEWTGIIAQRKVRSNRLGCLRGMVERASRGEFRLELGYATKNARRAAEHQQKRLSERPPLPPADPGNPLVKRLTNIRQSGDSSSSA